MAAKPLTFILIDEGLTEYGYWVQVAGVDYKQFLKNPIMLWMHYRATKGEEDEVLPIGYWENIRVENGQLLADAVFDENDPFAMRIKKKVESGVLRMASVWLKPVDLSEDAKLLKPGQTAPTVTKSKLREASIVDIGGNDGSLRLCDDAGNPYQLSDLKTFHKKSNKMSEINKALKLADNASEQSAVEQIVLMQTTLSDKDKKITELTGKVNDYEANEQNARKASVKVMLSDAAKDGRIDADATSDWEQQFAKDFDGTKLMLDKLPKRQNVAAKLKDGDGDAPENKEAAYAKLSWNELDKGRHMEDVKLNFPDLYKKKFKERFGKEPNL